MLNGFRPYYSIFFLLLINIGFAQVPPEGITISKNDTIKRVELVRVESDTITNDSIKNERIQDVVDYDSDDQYHDMKNQFSYLVKNAKVRYLDFAIDADYIEINWQTGDVYAVGKQDSTGKVLEYALFKQGDKTIEYNSFSFNIKTKRGKAYNVRTEESIGSDKGMVVAGVVKQYSDTISGMRHVAYTTDTYFIEGKDTMADYYLQTEEAKYIEGKNKKVVTGPIVMKIYDVTTPFALPFSFLPMGEGRSAGFLLPSFGEREDVGFFLQNAGLYLPIGEYVDLAVTGDVYTRGSLGLHALSQYKKKYRFNGNFRFDWEKRVTGIKGLDDYAKQTLYRLSWSHRQDAKANPNLIFAANVNFSSSQYYRNGINNVNLINGDVLTNTTSSSISINKTFPESPFTASLTMSHSQNNSPNNTTNPVTFNLPILTVSMSRIYPFAPKAGSKKGLLQSIGMNYNMNVQNTINTTDEELFTSEMFKSMRSGAKHQLNLNTGTTLFNFFPLSFSAGYNEVWYLKTIRKLYNQETDEVDDVEVNGFDSYRTFNTSASLQTTLYMTKIFGSKDDDKLIKGFRHMVTPSAGISFTPDFSDEFWGYYDTYRDGNGVKKLYTRFEDGIFGAPGRGLQTNLNFGLSNNIEMKVRSRKDSTGMQKIKIFEYLNFGGSYNLAADSLKLSPISMTGATSILQNKMRVNFSAIFDPYKIYYNPDDETYTRIDELGSFRVSNYQVGLTYSLNNSTFGEKEEMEYPRRGSVRNENFYFDDDGYAKFSMPWNMNLSLNHTRSQNISKVVNTQTSLQLSGSLSPTPYWSISGSTNFDLGAGEISYTRLSFSRDLRSFVIDFSWVPFGRYRTWDFFIGIKANFLRDAIKYEENNFNTGGNDF